MSPVPAECESSGCMARPTHKIRYKEPIETLYYCKRHYNQLKSMRTADKHAALD